MTRLKYSAVISAGQSPSSDDVAPLVDGLPFLQGNAEFGSRSPVPTSECDASPRVAAAGDILVSVRAPVGAVNVADREYGIGRGLSAVSPRKIDPDYAFWFLQSSAGTLNSVATGSTYAAVSAGDVGNLVVPVVNREEQRRIAEFLDRETAQIDELIAKQEQLISTLAERRATVVERAIVRGIPEVSDLRDSGVYWLGEIPRDWRVSKFTRVVSINGGQVDPRDEPFASMTLIAPNHIEKATGKLLAVESAREQGADSGKYFVRKGQVIYSKIRPALRKATLAPHDCLCSADMYGISANPRELREEYLLLLLLSRPFTQFTIDVSSRVAMPKVNREALAGAHLWYPTLAEQDHLLAALAGETSKTDALIEKSIRAVEMLRERRQALIGAAVTGQIDVGGAS